MESHPSKGITLSSANRVSQFSVAPSAEGFSRSALCLPVHLYFYGQLSRDAKELSPHTRWPTCLPRMGSLQMPPSAYFSNTPPNSMDVAKLNPVLCLKWGNHPPPQLGIVFALAPSLHSFWS